MNNFNTGPFRTINHDGTIEDDFAPCAIAGEHCSQCGSVDLEDLGYGDDDYDGYTGCCNEPATSGFCSHDHN